MKGPLKKNEGALRAFTPGSVPIHVLRAKLPAWTPVVWEPDVPPPDIAREPDPVVAVVLDRTHARFFEVSGRRVVEVTGLISPGTRGGRFHSDRADAPGGGEHAYHQRLREEERRHYAAIARRLLELKRVRGARGLLVAGPGPVPRAFRRALPEGLAARVIGTAQLNPLEVTARAVQRATARARQGHVRAALLRARSQLVV